MGYTCCLNNNTVTAIRYIMDKNSRPTKNSDDLSHYIHGSVSVIGKTLSIFLVFRDDNEK